MAHLPNFDDLPEVKGWRSAWGLWDKDGKKDVYGTLNILTPEIIKAAYTEAREGIHVSLNWPIDGLKTPAFGRKGLVHKTISYIDTPMAAHVYDDELEFNTQCSSQWDSLVHYNHQSSASGYNGATAPDILAQGEKETIPTLDHWHQRGGLVARGVLIDFKRYCEETGRSFNPFSSHEITITDIETIAARQNVTCRPGDVLIIRSGFTEALTNISPLEQEELMSSNRYCGVTGTTASARWFWNHHFSAVAGDMIAFEHIPPLKMDGSKEEAENSQMGLHQYFLGMFGMSIGELWDLEKLGEVCAELGRWSFLLTSVPLNVKGLVGSPPNAIAIF